MHEASFHFNFVILYPRYLGSFSQFTMRFTLSDEFFKSPSFPCLIHASLLNLTQPLKNGLEFRPLIKRDRALAFFHEYYQTFEI